MCYRIDADHDAAYDLTILWNDPSIDIPWPLPVTGMSAKDRAAPPLEEVREQLG